MHCIERSSEGSGLDLKLRACQMTAQMTVDAMHLGFGNPRRSLQLSNSRRMRPPCSAQVYWSRGGTECLPLQLCGELLWLLGCSHRNGCTGSNWPCAAVCGSGPTRGDWFLFEVCARGRIAGRERCGRCCASPWNARSCILTQQSKPAPRHSAEPFAVGERRPWLTMRPLPFSKL
jgi:hypothetical protein